MAQPSPAAPVTAAKQNVFKKAWHGVVAAVTSPAAVKQERSLAALVVGRVLLAVGSSYGVEQLIVKIVHG